MSTQRWSIVLNELGEEVFAKRDNGELVMYDDHERALAEAAVPAGVWEEDSYDAGYAAGLAAKPRTLTADDPEPAVGSVVLDKDGSAWQRDGDYWFEALTMSRWPFTELRPILSPLRLIHDGGQA